MSNVILRDRKAKTKEVKEVKLRTDGSSGKGRSSCARGNSGSRGRVAIRG